MRNITVTLGILIALIPFLGFPGIVEDVFFVGAGLSIAIVAYYNGAKSENYKTYNSKIVNSVENAEVKNNTTKEIHNSMNNLTE